MVLKKKQSEREVGVLCQETEKTVLAKLSSSGAINLFIFFLKNDFQNVFRTLTPAPCFICIYRLQLFRLVHGDIYIL